MAREDEKAPEIAVEDAEQPRGDSTLEPGARGADLASAATSPTLSAPGASEAEAETEAPVPEPAAVEVPARADPSPGTELETRPYRPTEDYVVGDRIVHPIWNAAGVVTYRDPREQVFRIPIGRVEERGRCHLIRVEFEQEVPAAGGSRREVMLIADWRGRPFEVGAPARRAPEPLLALPEVPERPAAARSRAPLLPEIPEPEEEEEEEGATEESEEEESEEERVEPIGI
ncbi:MAG: hypothetical protein HY321_19990 [Armatimonadetes bacterium]|nr:hypothetical protein [Armatimonadota bacterium]